MDTNTPSTTPGAGDPAHRQRPHGTGLIVLRLLITALGAALGVVLITRGLVVVGAILVVMALLRLLLVLGVRRRRRRWADQRAQRAW